MPLFDILRTKNMTLYRLAKESGVPYTTLHDIYHGKAQPEKCSAETVYRIAKALNLSMEDLLAPYLEKQSSFEIFKDTLCHRLKGNGRPRFHRGCPKKRGYPYVF